MGNPQNIFGIQRFKKNRMNEILHEHKQFDKVDFSGQELYEIEYISCRFINCNFSYTNLSESDFMDCSFDNCNFSLVKVKGTGFKNSRFLNSKITGVDFSKCHDFLFSFQFQSCIVDYCSFYGRKLKKTMFQSCSIKETDFSEADLTEASFDNCDLLNTIFRQTILEKTDFRSAVNFLIDPEINKIKKAKFSLYGLPGLLEKYQIIIE